MPANTTEIRRLLADFDFTRLLVEELGWNRYRAIPLDLLVDAVRYALKPAAEKCGLVVYECSPGPDQDIPAYPLRRKIEGQVAKLTHEHLIIFVDAARKNQIWQWVRRQSGQPIRYREITWRAGQTNESLIQILPRIAFELEEEERLTIVEVASRVQQQVNERVTKQFYDRFRDEHEAFLKFIDGIKELADREWYASLMLNRLMFIYFIQKKGFLDNDRDYLRNRLRKMQAGFGKGHFHRFYRLFLLRLFHEGLGQPEADRSPELAALLGKVPYLNGGLFDVHELEIENPGIQIPDAAFEKIFEFFDAYHWHLDERPLRADNEINPDVLGYIFEKYINNKQMGAYYTKEDITGYISRNTIIPFVLEAARKQCPIAFVADGGVWRLLRNDPDRYIHEAVRKGVDLNLPSDIAAGLSDMTKRTGWNRAADGNLALPTETWREYIGRRHRCYEIRRKLQAGEVTSINDLVTLNLDIERFVLDAVAQSEGPELVRAFWGVLKQISVLETRRKAIEYKVKVLGFDLTHAQQRGFEAALAILTRGGYRSKKVRLTLDQWHADYGVEKKESARGWIEASQFTRLQSLNVLRELATIPWLIYYEKQVAPNRWQIVERIGPLWQLTIGYELTDEERRRFNGGDRSSELLDKLKAIEIEFNDVWLDQHENHYFWKPGNLLQQMFLALHGRRPPDHLNNFVTWILSEAEMKRRQSQPLELSTTLDDLANKCRLTGQMRHGNRTRVLATLKRNAEVAQKVNLITSFDFEDPQHLRLTCSTKVFAEAQEWAKRRQGNRAEVKTLKPSQAAAQLFPSEIDKMLKDIAAQIEALRGRREVSWDGIVRRELTTEERSAIEALTARRGALQEQKYGVRIPPAQAAPA